MKPSVWQALEGAKLVKEKVVLITGAAAGIGKACALLFAHQGGRLALVDLQEEGLKQVCEEVNEGRLNDRVAIATGGPGGLERPRGLAHY